MTKTNLFNLQATKNTMKFVTNLMTIYCALANGKKKSNLFQVITLKSLSSSARWNNMKY